MCECARRVLKRRSLEGKRVLPPGPQIFYHGQHCVSPHWPVWGNTILQFVGNGSYTLYHAGLKVPFPGPEQLARFWDIRVILLAIINSHDLARPHPSPSPNWAFSGWLAKKLKKSQILGWAPWPQWLWNPISP